MNISPTPPPPPSPSPSPPSPPTTTTTPDRPVPTGAPAIRWRSVAIFIAVAYAVFALCATPFWFLEGGIAHPLYAWVLSVGMFAPMIATLVVVKLVDKGSWRTAVGLRFRGRWKRLALWIPLAVLVVLAINVASAVIMVLRGVPGDLTGRTWAGILSDSMAEAGAPMPMAAAVALVLGVSAVNLLVTTLPALGEEIGWRGWLWQQLKPLGFLGALTLGGVIWSLWHLPVTLIGHNYPGAPRPLAIGMFLIACVAMNFLFGAITERSCGNPIPAAFAHATVNSTLGLVIGIVATSETMDALDWFIDTPLGAIGIVLMAIAAYLIMPRRARAGFGKSAPRTAGHEVEWADGRTLETS